MVLITKDAMQNDTFMELFQTYKYNLSPTNMRSNPLDIYTTHKMSPGKSHAYKYFVGGKTGYLNESKANLVTVAKKNGRTLIAFVAGNDSPYDICEDTTTLFENSFKNFKNVSISIDRNNNSLNNLISNGKYKIKRSIAPSSSIAITLPEEINKKEVTFKITDFDPPFPIKKGDVTGQVEAIYKGKVVGSVSLTAKKNMNKFKFISLLILKIAIVIIVLFISLIILLRIYFTKIKPYKYKKKSL